MSEIKLNNISPDFAGIKALLEADLTTRDSWQGFLTTQTGQTLIDQIASIGAFAQAKGLRIAQDAYSETAVSSRAQYAIADMQGLRLTRKNPASVTVNASYIKPPTSGGVTFTVPAFAQFEGAGTYWFTEQSTVIADGATASITLYQGYVVDQTIQGPGVDYAVFVSPEKDFSVSDRGAHIQVFRGSSPIERTVDGLWNFEGDEAFQDRTTPDGRLHLQFGNAVYGYRPEVADVVRIRYAVTSGEDGNSVLTLNTRLAPVNTMNGMSFVFTSNPTGGSNPPPASLYKTLSPANFGSFGAAVTSKQYLGLALSYPGIVDVRLRAQRDRDPNDYRLMNSIEVIPLTSSVWTVPQRNDFFKFMEKASMFSTQMYWTSPTPVPRNLRIVVYCRGYANSSECLASVQDAIEELFSVRRGILGLDIVQSDLHRVALASNPGVEYIDVISPEDDMFISGRAMEAPSLVVQNGIGALPAGQYSYSVYATDVHGSTQAVNYTTVTAGANARITLTWDAYPNATGYSVVGRGPTYGVIANVSATTFSYQDNSATAYLTTDLPTVADYPVLYNSLNSLNITAEYSTRA